MPVTLLVENRSDQTIAWMLLDRARIPLEDVAIRPCGGMDEVVRTARAWPADGDALAVLIDAHDLGLEAAQSSLRKSLARDDVHIFAAAPNIENWVIGDPVAAQSIHDAASSQLPQSAETPVEFLASTIDVERAAALNPSLRDFLAGMQQLVGVPVSTWTATPGRTLSRDVLAGLLQELPTDEVAWRTSSGDKFTAGELIRAIETGTEEGRQFASDLLRVARDLIKREAKKRS